ncbi:MAG: OB-fold domain-containing protein [Actinomycetes bacterium]
MARVPIEAGFFRIPDDPSAAPVLLGSRCPDCDEVFFPRRLVCARCLSVGCLDVELSGRGRLWTWTYCYVPMFGKVDSSVPGYGVGQVDLPEGPRVQAILLGTSSDFRIGMEVEIDLETLREDAAGDDVVIYRFRPVSPSPTEET